MSVLSPQGLHEYKKIQIGHVSCASFSKLDRSYTCIIYIYFVKLTF